jgi:hypothetical protein
MKFTVAATGQFSLDRAFGFGFTVVNASAILRR